jgi:hypothetical protein
MTENDIRELNERKLILEFIKENKDVIKNYYLSGIGTWCPYDAVIEINGKTYIVEIKTRKTPLQYCMIEKYKYLKLMAISKNTGYDILFITIDSDGYYMLNLTKQDIEPYFFIDLRHDTQKDQKNNKKREWQFTYNIPKNIFKHYKKIEPTISDLVAIQKGESCSYKLENDESPFYKSVVKKIYLEGEKRRICERYRWRKELETYSKNFKSVKYVSNNIGEYINSNPGILKKFKDTIDFVNSYTPQDLSRFFI